MSSPTDRPDKPDDHLAYAPKWVRDSNREGSHETPSIAEGELPQHSEQSVPKEGLISNQARAHRPLDTASLTASHVQNRARQILPRGAAGLRVPGGLRGGQPAAGGVETRWSAARHREAGRSARNRA